MSLPKIQHPTFSFTIPSMRKKGIFRPFVVREEKILLMAKQSGDPVDIIRSIKQVINNCSCDDRLDINKLATFDIEYLFLQLRAVSVNNIVHLVYRDNDDDKLYEFDVDITQIECNIPSKVDNNKIKVTDSIGILLKYPSASILDEPRSNEDQGFDIITGCIDKIFDGDEVFDPQNYSKQELEEFLDDCGVDVYEKLQQFVSNIPKLYHKLEYVNSNGKTRTIEMTSLADFFQLG